MKRPLGGRLVSHLFFIQVFGFLLVTCPRLRLPLSVNFSIPVGVSVSFDSLKSQHRWEIDLLDPF